MTANQTAAADQTRKLVIRFLNAVSDGDRDAMVECVSDDVVHDVNQGGERRMGKDRFEAYTARMQHHYEETVSDPVVFVSDDGTRAAVEYNLAGKYIQTEDGLPPACGQTFILPAAMFFATRDGKFSRVTTYYNLTDWLTQIVHGYEAHIADEQS